MNEQTSLFETDESTAYGLLRPSLLNVIESNWLDPDKLSFNKNKGYCSVTFGPYVVVRLYGQPKPGFSIPRSSDIGDVGKIALADLSEITSWADQICEALQGIIDAIPTEFSCCSRYAECSDRRACTNPDRSFASGCSYRKVLKSGKVFYGRNRNID